ncbi:uncharacterized protein PV07_04157 [Cladophialophora immunda]|uniref:Acyl-CoA dehydrogenase/oxidase C-terminal domain-containing protein n=1 Tax=Cladophialophora immunda TaxID=569365 RepID=A0A0D1ZWU5_9EURO|nr:uncharacterized protein PV07_04157 [Cladophialophora immunda]KIW32626.1 hypothetical protein PV07_04157 [Cladophialophora immunda]
MSPLRSDLFGEKIPWSEPAWYNALESPYYNKSHRALRQYIRDYIETHVLPFAEEWEDQGQVPLEETVKFAKAGLAFPEIPKDYRSGSSLPGGVRDDGGSDLANLRTTATKSQDGKHYIVNGHKKWITGALTATHMTTAVRTGGPGAGGISVLVIPTSSMGFSARKIHNSGTNAGGSAWVDLENVLVPVDNLIGPENQGFPILMSNFNTERFIMAVKMNRLARQCLSTALEYSYNRETFGKPLVSHQIIRHKFTHLARYIESHWAWIEQIAYHIKVSGWNSDVASRIALAKVHGGTLLEIACREAQQVLGGAGYQRGGVGGTVEQISRDLRMLVVGGGSEEILSDLAFRQEVSAAKKRGSML